MAQTYIPMVLMIAIAFVLGSLLVAASIILGPKYPNEVKDYPFECGHLIDNNGARKKHSVKFYMVAIIFLLFDLEIVFMYPWATVFREIGLAALLEMFLFLGILIVGYIYIWKKGVLEWE